MRKRIAIPRERPCLAGVDKTAAHDKRGKGEIGKLIDMRGEMACGDRPIDQAFEYAEYLPRYVS